MPKFPGFNQHQEPQPLNYDQFQDLVIADLSDVSGITSSLPDRVFTMIDRSEQGLSIGEVIDLLTDTKPDDLPPRDAEWISDVVRPLMRAMMANDELILTPVIVAARLKGHPRKKGDPLDIINAENRLKRGSSKA